MDAAAELLKLAEEKFGKLRKCEKELFQAVANGQTADYSSKDEKKNDPAKAAKWGPSRILNADRIAWLCTDKQASQLVTHRGIQIKGARIDDRLDLLFAKIPFPFTFQRCKLTAEINLQCAQIAALIMEGTHTGPILADGLILKGSLYLCARFKAEGEIRLVGAKIGGVLNCVNALFSNRDGDALSADRLKVEGAVFLRDGFKAEGGVRLLGATIGGDFDCVNAHFINKDGKALVLDGLDVEGSILLGHGFKAEGEVRLLGAAIGGNLDCENGQFINEKRNTLSADGFKVKGCVFLRNGFKANGEVRLLTGTVDGNLDCANGRFINKGGRALYADGLKVGGHVLLRTGFKSEGRVDFIAARIDKHFCMTGVDSPEGMMLDLTSAKIGTLYDDRDSWPAPGQLVLHGLEYKEISRQSPRDSKSRIEWLRLQEGFWPQPYEQLAKVLRESGDDVGAKDVLIAKNKDKAERTEKLTVSQWLWYRVFGPLIGYGHKPMLAMRWAVPIIVLGWLFFAAGYSHGLITPPSESAYTDYRAGAVPDPGDPNLAISGVYPVFNSLFYSIDTFVPVVDFHQGRYWLPNANRGSEIIPWGPWPLCWGGLLLFWLWFETICGWVLTTLFLVGFTGLVRT
ncbi:MAG: hypothetical protein ABIF19_02290 [Planctomycetota bacterium]